MSRITGVAISLGATFDLFASLSLGLKFWLDYSEEGV